MLLDLLVQEHNAVLGRSAVSGQCEMLEHAPGALANDNAGAPDDVVVPYDVAPNDNAEPVSGVVPKAAVADAVVAKQSPPDDRLKSRAEVRTHAMHRFLSAQTDVSEEVLQLYKLVCTGFR